MSDSTTNLDTISSSQASKETTANAMFDALSPASLFGRRATTTSALTWGYYGGKLLVNGVITSIANGTVALTASQTNYVEATRAGVVSKNITGFTPGSIPLYTVVTGGSTITSYTDKRCIWFPVEGILQRAVGSPQVVVLTAEEALNDTIELTGALTSEADLVVPNVAKHYTVYANTSGAGIRVVNTGSPQSGVSIAAGMSAIVRCDGASVKRVTADVTP